MFNFTGNYTDKYQLTMAQIYFLKGVKEPALFDYFFRKLPFNGGYAVFAGLNDLLEILENFHFKKEEIDFLKEQGFDANFLAYLKDFRFKGNIFSCQEGEIVFPVCPILTVEASIIEAQIIETILLNTLNFQTLIATKARRMRYVAGKRQLIEFGLRRAQGPGGLYASRAAIIGGFNATSNVYAGQRYKLPIAGTMAHSFIQRYDDELEAFRDFSNLWPEDCILLVDTYNTLESGLPKAIAVGKEMQRRGQPLKGIRLDSGDLAYLAKAAREMLDEAGLHQVQIIASNQLDEYVIKSLIDQEAPIDAFGVGTNLVVGHPDAALDGVYKLAFANGKPRIKLSENISKITLPDKKQVLRIVNEEEIFYGADAVVIESEKDVTLMHHPFDVSRKLSLQNYKKEPLLRKVMENGKSLQQAITLSSIVQYSQERFNQLPEEYKRFDNPHIYKVGLSSALRDERDALIKKYKIL
ncbi:nicotinate phosphoribosyltransferase [Legionella jamestowniensis]|uniref:Nicotinate phosphoribosyltransferase n=1 Tax=Legionella jamestowniensis TaxID=455 RepID=A0A0W0UKS3_9GAMM|nr:nicotinate phosphoribosyltransferase [Legionella jamestowniensis]KTD08137.1 nicotinate phosphoribosyltransferase [Legionella jamestowniensis]SFL99435.1 nicotinate phosphoribosyltransferase [Legionella jamestowniensis DSM 19215]